MAEIQNLVEVLTQFMKNLQTQNVQQQTPVTPVSQLSTADVLFSSSQFVQSTQLPQGSPVATSSSLGFYLNNYMSEAKPERMDFTELGWKETNEVEKFVKVRSCNLCL
ncbi:hypothetical protein RN001_013447 [Aquatica leii]|uniref:Uncharacterized protein n=1 Tax=Aquatica leii TaxID=1421715 RepID=A0AAN7PRS3_9COLE|nr:hypothetical protein RN001_013447 [Aquatica leii]